MADEVHGYNLEIFVERNVVEACLCAMYVTNIIYIDLKGNDDERINAIKCNTKYNE